MPLVSSTIEDGKALQWKEVTFDVEVGPHVFTWEFLKDTSEDEGLNQAIMKFVEFEGTSYSDLQCHPCNKHMSKRAKHLPGSLPRKKGNCK